MAASKNRMTAKRPSWPLTDARSFDLFLLSDGLENGRVGDKDLDQENAPAHSHLHEHGVLQHSGLSADGRPRLHVAVCVHKEWSLNSTRCVHLIRSSPNFSYMIARDLRQSRRFAKTRRQVIHPAELAAPISENICFVVSIQVCREVAISFAWGLRENSEADMTAPRR
jgi:hypothetical protein